MPAAQQKRVRNKMFKLLTRCRELGFTVRPTRNIGRWCNRPPCGPYRLYLNGSFLCHDGSTVPNCYSSNLNSSKIHFTKPEQVESALLKYLLLSQ